MAENALLQRLDGLDARFEEIGTLITDPNVIADQRRYVKLTKEYKSLETLLNATNRYRKLLEDIEQAKLVLESETDEDLRAMAREEIDANQAEVPKMEEEIKLLLIPEDPEDSKNVVLEIRGGTGGDEAALFAGDLARMYTRYCETKGWNVQMSSCSEGAVGGFKEVVFSITGDNVYGTLKYESGVHRVQRVPVTETQGRVHTSAATVAVLPEAEEVDIKIEDKDLRIDICRASGPGGQGVNTTDSAVRITHLPTGIVVQQQDERSQHKNMDKAMKILRSKLYDLERSKKDKERAENRKEQIGTGDRSDKIRTYNYPQGRVTDHRINLTLYKLDQITQEGDLDELIDALITDEEAKKLANSDI